MLQKLLIANRGEIACRVMKTAKLLGITCVAIYSDADENALHVKQADEAYYIGPSPSAESYLQSEKIIAIAKQSGCDGIHPGYGFLSENAQFAKHCEEQDVIFIGPTSHAIAMMGSKSIAKKIMEKDNIPLLPGYHGDAQDFNTLQQQADKIGYPVLIKAAAGGGGKGMHIVYQSNELKLAIEQAKRQAKASFDDPTLLLEKYLAAPRHIEIQIFADNHGNCIHLFERDCSIQRRHQKIIEEAPATNFPTNLREEMGQAAVAAAKAIDYRGAGTVEFLLDEDQQFYFMEMNTRLQVEHAVTEMICHLDLVEWQLRIACGEPLPITQSQLKIDGHAIECRIYAENPEQNFLPTMGEIRYLHYPEHSAHLRIDSGIATGDQITSFYDPMLAKLIVWDKVRSSAINRLQNALSNFHLLGVTTNLSFLSKISHHAAFATGKFNTSFINSQQQQLLASSQTDIHKAAYIACLYQILQRQQKANLTANNMGDPHSPWYINDRWRLNIHDLENIYLLHQQQPLVVKVQYRCNGHYLMVLDNDEVNINGTLETANKLHVTLNKQKFTVHVVAYDQQISIMGKGLDFHFSYDHISSDETQDANLKPQLSSPMPGTIVSIDVNHGDKVKKGQSLMIIEAMKMEHSIYAPDDGTITEIFYRIGDMVNEGVELLTFKACGKSDE